MDCYGVTAPIRGVIGKYWARESSECSDFKQNLCAARTGSLEPMVMDTVVGPRLPPRPTMSVLRSVLLGDADRLIRVASWV